MTQSLNIMDRIGTQWVPEGGKTENLGGSLHSAPAAIAWGSNRFDVRIALWPQGRCNVLKITIIPISKFLLCQKLTLVRLADLCHIQGHIRTLSPLLGRLRLVWVGGYRFHPFPLLYSRRRDLGPRSPRRLPRQQTGQINPQLLRRQPMDRRRPQRVPRGDICRHPRGDQFQGRWRLE